MSDRDEVSRFPLGELEAGERYVGCLHFREGVSFVEAARVWHEVATYASVQFGRMLDTDDAEVCREFNVGASVSIFGDSIASVVEAEREAAVGEER